MAKQLVERAPMQTRDAAGAILRGRSLYATLKPVSDLFASAIILLLALPLLALVAALIALESPGPIIFRQERIGLNGHPFTIYKFRSMFASTSPYSFKVPCSDPRVTRVGRWLRLTGLDELPQLINVLRGEMSLIGPRPEMAFIVDQYEDWQRRRLSIRPGITGWWQVHHRNEVPMHLNLEYDLYYLEHFSFWLDCQIACRTLLVMLSAPVRVWAAPVL